MAESIGLETEGVICTSEVKTNSSSEEIDELSEFPWENQ